MTVKELIVHLSAMPPEATVIYSMFSEYAELRADEVQLVTEADHKICLRHGNYMDDPAYWPPGEKPVFVTVVRFPGN